jgi:hypothetical protein
MAVLPLLTLAADAPGPRLQYQCEGLPPMPRAISGGTAAIPHLCKKLSSSDRDIMRSGVHRRAWVGGVEAADAGHVGFERYAKTTQQAGFLAEMERVVPWSGLCALIEPFYPKPGNGRPPVGGRADAAHLFSAAMVQPVGPGGGRGAQRFAWRCRVLSASISAASRCRMRRGCAASATC